MHIYFFLFFLHNAMNGYSEGSVARQSTRRLSKQSTFRLRVSLRGFAAAQIREDEKERLKRDKINYIPFFF